MGTFDSSALLTTPAYRGIKPVAIVATEKTQPSGDPVFPRIRELEVELAYYRQKLEDLVQQRTEKLARRISILEACNSNLCESYHHMRQMYLVLLSNTQPREDGTAATGSFE